MTDTQMNSLIAGCHELHITPDADSYMSIAGNSGIVYKKKVYYFKTQQIIDTGTVEVYYGT